MAVLNSAPCLHTLFYLGLAYREHVHASIIYHRGLPQPQSRSLYVLPAVRDAHEIVATFQLPCLTAQYGAKAEQYISHLVGHEGPGSLLSLLKVREGCWARVAAVTAEGA